MTITTEEKGAGRGRKQCPACQKYMGVRTATCACGHEFGVAVAKPKAEVAAKPNKLNSPSPQWLQRMADLEDACPSVSVGGLAADLGLLPKKQEPEDEPEGDAQPGWGCRRVWTPAGKSPAKLEGTSREEVHRWAEKVRKHGFDNGVHYLVQALRYWAREFHDINGADYQTVRAHLYNLYPYEASAG